MLKMVGLQQNNMCDQATGINNFLMPNSWRMLIFIVMIITAVGEALIGYSDF